jgi:hypothetical protein
VQDALDEIQYITGGTNTTSYYAQVMFSNNHGNTVLPTTLTTTGGSKVYAS